MELLGGAQLRDSGEDAFVIEFGEAIDPPAGRKVAALTAAFDAAALHGVLEVVPTFRSLLVIYDPDMTDREAILAGLTPARAGERPEPASWQLPVCVDGALAEDLEEAAQELGLEPQEVRERLVGARYQVGMFGFAPGFAYLAGLDEALAIPRRPEPRPPMPAGSLIIAGGMAALTSIAMPTGWYVVGRTAIELFRPEADQLVPFAVGDTIGFVRVSEAELADLEGDPDGGLERA